MDRAGAIAMSVYGVGWLIAFIRSQFFLSAETRADRQHYLKASASRSADQAMDEDNDAPFIPVTWTEKLSAVAVQVVLGALIACFWPAFVFAYVSGAFELLFSRKRGRA